MKHLQCISIASNPKYNLNQAESKYASHILEQLIDCYFLFQYNFIYNVDFMIGENFFDITQLTGDSISDMLDTYFRLYISK